MERKLLMRSFRRILAFTVLVVVSAVFTAAQAPVTAAAPGQSPQPSSAPTGPGTGPYPAIAEVDPGLPGFTIFRPQNLGGLGSVRLPIVTWANGACANSPSGFEPFLTEIASHGFLVIAVGTIPPQPGQSSSKQLTQAIDWALAQNARADSKYKGKLDATKIAVGGMSCGGLQALEVAPDPRLTTVMVCNSGVLPDGPRPANAPKMPVTVTKDILKQLHTPMLYLMGGPKDIAYNNAMDDFSRIEKVPVFMLNHDVGHGGTYRQENGGEFGKVAVAWLKWQLKNDPAAKKMLVGADCGFCTNSAWKIQVKNYD